MAEPGAFEVIRDPLWNNIRIDAEALAVLGTEPVQRLRYVRQLGHAFLVYPGATHTRFEHALGTYHLARRTMAMLKERGELVDIDGDEVALIRLSALLHDIGHYPFSHALEEAGLPSHEMLASMHLQSSELQTILQQTCIDAADSRIADLIRGQSPSPLQGLISGTLDLDKIDYLTRDARMCGVPYGTVDVDRLINSITVVEASDGSITVAVHEKGVSALESLLFAKYQMYRNVYWHHGVRSATAMFKRLVRTAIRRDQLEAAWIAQSTDEALMETLRVLPNAPLAMRLRRRHLYKRALDISATQLPPISGAWIAEDPDLTERVEDRMAEESGLAAGDVLLDFPRKPAMLSVDLLVHTREGAIEQLDAQDSAERLGIQHVADELHTSARRLRVFSAHPIEIDRHAVLSLVERDGPQIRNALDCGDVSFSIKG